jgi:hypothetical protein
MTESRHPEALIHNAKYGLRLVRQEERLGQCAHERWFGDVGPTAVYQAERAPDLVGRLECVATLPRARPREEDVRNGYPEREAFGAGISTALGCECFHRFDVAAEVVREALLAEPMRASGCVL